MDERIGLSVISPMYNEEENVASTVERVRAALADMPEPWELILVDDGSADGTLAAARALEAERPWLRVLSYPENRGRGKAMRTGFAAARGEIVATTDFDLSYSPDHLRRIYDEFRANPGVEVVLGSPYMPGGAVEDVPWLRLCVSRWGNKLLSFAMGGGYRTITCILRGYRRHVLEALDLQEDGKEIHLEILSKVTALGFRVKEIPARLRGRTRGKSKFKLRSTSTTHLLFTIFERPMIVFGGIGLVLFLLGFIAGIAIVAMRYMGTLNPNRPLVTLMTLLVLAGIQVVSVGFIALQLVALRREIYRVQKENRELERLIRRGGDSSK